MSSSNVNATACIFLTRPLSLLGLGASRASFIARFLEDFLAVTGGESQTLQIEAAVLPSLPDILAVANPQTVKLLKTYFGDVESVARGHVRYSLGMPIAIALACHFFDIDWHDWFLALGANAFHLVIKRTCVYVVKDVDGTIGVIWSDNKAVARPPQTVAPAPLSFPSPSLSSTMDLSSSCEYDSRPSSRSSNYSSFSFSSRSSASSQSSIVSCSLANKPPTHAFSSFLAQTPTQASFEAARDRLSLNRNTDIGTSTPSKLTIPATTKYIYQGGESTVLSGGVMLGPSRPNPLTPPSKPTSPVYAPSYHSYPTCPTGRIPYGPGVTSTRDRPSPCLKV